MTRASSLLKRMTPIVESFKKQGTTPPINEAEGDDLSAKTDEELQALVDADPESESGKAAAAELSARKNKDADTSAGAGATE